MESMTAEPFVRVWPHGRECIGRIQSGAHGGLKRIADLFPKSLLFDERREPHQEAKPHAVVARDRVVIATVVKLDGPSSMGRQLLESGVVVVDSQTNLLEIIATAHSPRGFAGGLNRGQQQPHEYANDGDDDEQFHECEAMFRI